jgi:hypothetical protein
MMSAIEAASVRVATMADGTLRLTVDVEPRFAVDAFRLFGSPGVPLALAALKIGAEPEPEKPKGGPLAILAGRWCNDLTFHEWLSVKFPQEWAACAGMHPRNKAATVVRHVCGIESRAELDSNQGSASLFNVHIREPYSKHLIACGVVSDAV